MASIKIPTPLRAYTGGQAEVQVSGALVSEILEDLTAQYPDLRQHLFSGDKLRDFVNVFIGEEDIRFLEGLGTEVGPSDKLRIIPSIAGGQTIQVDHSALRVNQAFIIGFLLLAFILNAALVVAFVSVVMLIGTAFPTASLFKRIYQHLLKPQGWVKPDIQADDPAPHRFAQGLGGVVTLLATLALLGSVPPLGWGLAWVVIGLAALNLFAGFCVGCFIYYQLGKRHILGFKVPHA